MFFPRAFSKHVAYGDFILGHGHEPTIVVIIIVVYRNFNESSFDPHEFLLSLVLKNTGLWTSRFLGEFFTRKLFKKNLKNILLSLAYINCLF